MRPSTYLATASLWCIGLLACAPVLVPPSAELRVVTGAGRAMGAPTAFHAEVHAVGRDSSLPPSQLRARVTLELKGDALEYRMQLRNPGSELVKEAWVTTLPEAGTASSAVVQLFSDAVYRNSIIELRGMATVRASMKPSAIADELQGAPQRFMVVLKGAGPQDVWSGTLREGR